MEKNKVSIIVPVYNVEKYLRECVDSIIQQNYENWEIILVDDGSKDSSPAICDEYSSKDSRIITIHQENAGPSRARNHGLDKATGQFVMFVDSDDHINQNMISKMVETINSNQADLVICGYARFSDDSYDPRSYSNEPLILMTNRGRLANFYTKPNTNMFGISIWAKLYRNDIIQNNKIRFNPEISYEEDCQFNIDYFEKINRIAVINDIFYMYRQMTVSLSKGYKKDTFQFLVAGYNRRVQFVKDYSPKTSLNGLHGILLMVVKSTILKIYHSDLSTVQKIKEYQKLLDFEEVQYVASVLGKSKNNLTRVLQELIAKKSGLLLHFGLVWWNIYDKIRVHK